MFKGLDMNGLMKKAKEMQKTLAEKKENAAGKTVDVSVGGGMVQIKMNGNLETLSVKVDPEIVDKNEIEILEDLIRAACNEAVRKAKELVSTEFSDIMSGLDISDLSKFTS
ncbi:YbaB/EbfC family nucleoid-associated protein [bacterium]|nr:YbaB/EbfC family nucleoid-associated protein [bacterium]